MTKYAQLVVGPAGCGKSTYCHVMEQACIAEGKKCKIINMDPAAEEFNYDCWIDIRQVITSDDVMDEMDLGPNGALVQAMEFVVDNLAELEDDFDGFADDDYIIIDCPGQIELYTHLPVMTQFVKFLQGLDYQLCAVYCLDVTFVNSPGKFISGSLSCLSTMVQLGIGHVSVLTKCDLLSEQEMEELELKLEQEPSTMLPDLTDAYGSKYKSLHGTMCSLLEEFSLVGYVTLNVNDEESIEYLKMHIDRVLGYGENLEPKDMDLGEAGDGLVDGEMDKVD